MSLQDSPGMAALLAAMQDRRSVPDGWDVVLNLSEPAVQSIVRSTWRGGWGTDQALVWVAPAPVNGQHDVVEVMTALPPPTVSLSVSDQAVAVDFEIGSGMLRSGKASVDLVSSVRDPGSLIRNHNISWLPPIEITRQNPLQLAGSIPVCADAVADPRSFSIGLSRGEGNLTLSGVPTSGISSQAVAQSLGEWLDAQTLSGQIANLTLPGGAEAT